MFEFLRPPLHKNFIAGLHSLTEEYNEAAYRRCIFSHQEFSFYKLFTRFIKAFGTHFITKSKMGAIYGEQSLISSESWSMMVENGWNIGIMAGYSAMANANMSANYNETEAETFSRYVTK